MIYIASTEPDTIKYGLQWHEEPTITDLETGDIMLFGGGKTMLIERKGAPDLLNSMADGRLVEQCSRLVESCHFPMLLVHGSLLCNKSGKVVADGKESVWSWWALEMQLVSLQAAGVMWLHLQNVLNVPEAVKYLSDWLAKETHLHVYRKEKLPFVLPKKGMEVLASLPGIRLKKAADCLDYYGSAGRAIAELTCDGKSCFLPKGVAMGTVSKIREELGLGENERLELVLKEKEDATD
jgi:ERCC4-type nuclease